MGVCKFVTNSGVVVINRDSGVERGYCFYKTTEDSDTYKDFACRSYTELECLANEVAEDGLELTEVRMNPDDFEVYLKSFYPPAKIDSTGKSLSEHQPDPVQNNYPAVWDLVLKDMAERDATGKERYGTRLQPFNGRDVLVDMYQELLDAAVYTRQLIYERDGK